MTGASEDVRSPTRTHAGEAKDDARKTTRELKRTTDADSRPPRRIGRYRLEDELGRGGVGVVYEAWDEQLERPVALKTLIAGRDASETQVQRFLREVHAASHLRHPHIVPVHDAGEQDGCFYLAMELIDGRPLDALLEERGRLGPRETVGLLLPIVRALDYAHAQGIVHRDVKPENILVDSRGDSYLTDFGLALDLSEVSRLTRTHQSLGTPAFMAPEQMRGRSSDARVDLYAIGATLYEALTGRVPFDGENYADLMAQILQADPIPPRSLEPRIAPDLEAVVLKCLEKDPGRRYQTAAALAADLGSFLAGEAVAASPPGGIRRLGRRLRRHRAYALGAALALGGLLGGLVFAWVVERDAAAARRQKGHLEGERRRLLALHREALGRWEAEESKRLAFVAASLETTERGRIEAFDRFLADYPEAWEGRVARARLLRAFGREQRVRAADPRGSRQAFLRALEDLRLAASAASTPAPLHLLEAELLRTDLKDAASARAAYEAVAEPLPAEATQGPLAGLAEYARARLAWLDGDQEAAARELALCFARRSDLAPARLLQAELLVAEGRLQEALQRLDPLSGTAEAEAEAIRLRGEAMRRLGDVENARQDALRAVELDPEEPAAHLLLGRVRLDLRRHGQALSSLKRSLELSWANPTAHLLLAETLLRGWQDLPKAIQSVSDAKQQGAVDPQLLAIVRDLALEVAKERDLTLDEQVLEVLGR